VGFYNKTDEIMNKHILLFIFLFISSVSFLQNSLHIEFREDKSVSELGSLLEGEKMGYMLTVCTD
jgi:hypothetical protein